jgi:hypothetical protein
MSQLEFKRVHQLQSATSGELVNQTFVEVDVFDPVAGVFKSRKTALPSGGAGEAASVTLGEFELTNSTTPTAGKISFGSYADITWSGASTIQMMYLSWVSANLISHSVELFSERGTFYLERLSTGDKEVLPVFSRNGVGGGSDYTALGLQPAINGSNQWNTLVADEIIRVTFIPNSRSLPQRVATISTPSNLDDALAGFRQGDVIATSTNRLYICTNQSAFAAVWEDYPDGGSVPSNVVLDDGSTPFLAPQQGLPAVNSDELVTLGQLQASVECTDWEENPIIPANYTLRGAAYGNGIWLMIGSTSALLGQFLRSTDNYETLTVFTPSTPPGTFSDYDITFNNGTWILGSSSGARISRSTDNGDTWTDVFTGAAAVRRVKYANGRWIAVGASTITTLVSDDDGLTWNEPAVPLPAGGQWWGVAYGNGVWVAVGINNPPVAKSTDNGDTWTTVSGIPLNQWYDIEFANGVFIAVAQAGNALRIIRSVDLGDTWTTPTVPSPLIQLFGIAYGNNKWVACGDPGTSRVKESYDNGVTWVNSVPQLFTGNMRFLTFANGWFIAAHTGSIITRQGCVSAPSAIPPTWIDYISQWDIEPILEATITGGNVYAYTWRGVTRYRFVPSTYAPSLDAVYGDFDGVDLTDLITRRNS